MNIILAFTLILSLAAADGAEDRPTVVLVVGAAGGAEYRTRFHDWAKRWQEAANQGGARVVTIGLDEADATGTDRDLLKAALVDHPSATLPLWLVLIGHGTFDGRLAKFNLRGLDVTNKELADWLAPVKRPLALIDCTSASGPFLGTLSAANRVVVTATRSGDEQNYARFGQYLAESIADPSADLDKDGQVSLLEAFLTAGSRTNDDYKTHSRLATEHALLDDNGDKLGTPADFFRGVHAIKRAKDGATLDGTRAHQFHLVPSDRERKIPAELRHRRDELELAVATLRDQKEKLGADEYYHKLEPLMIELARLSRQGHAQPETKSRHEP